MGTSSQQYCLRWNNHRSNLLTVFDELLRSEAFTDVTLACEGGTSVKCHKMVLAACSSYFQSLFTELPCRHPVVVLKDVKYSEMKAILEYMYRGEVSVAQDQLAALLKVAETLKVKGLVEDRASMTGTPKELPESREEHHSPPTSGVSQSALPHSSSNISPPHSSSNTTYEKSLYLSYGKSPVVDRNSRLPLPVWAMPGLPFHHHSSPIPPPSHQHAAASTLLNSCYDTGHGDMSPLKRKKLQSLLLSSRDTPILRTVLGQGQADSSQPMALVCQPDSHDRIHSNGSAQDTDKQSLKADTSLEEARSPLTDIMVEEEPTNEKPNKIVLTSSTFPGAASPGIASYVPAQKIDNKRYKQYTPSEITSAIEAVRTGMSALQAAKMYGIPSRTLYDKVRKMGITTSRPFNKRNSNFGAKGGSYSPYNHSGSNSIGALYGSDGEEQLPNQATDFMEPHFLQEALDVMKREMEDRGGTSSSSAVSSGIAPYVPQQRPEWKRYKQYTREDILAAIEAVRTGMSALQAARKYGVPSRTLYDKVKKMGITTSRPFNKRGPNAGTVGGGYFSCNYAGSNSLGAHHAAGGDEQLFNQTQGVLEPFFLQNTLDGMKSELVDHGGLSSSPGENGHSPSQGIIKYHNSLTPSPEDERDEDRVEDLSIGRKPEPMGVIMAPVSSIKRDDEEMSNPHSEEHHVNSLDTADGD